MSSISIHKLQADTKLGFQLKSFSTENTTSERANALGPHRDDHYIFFLLTQGSGSLVVDFQDRSLGVDELFYILPSQVHHRIQARKATGWFIAVEPSLIDPEYQKIFEPGVSLQQPCRLLPATVAQCNNLLLMLNERCQEQAGDKISVKIIHLMLQTFVAIAADAYKLQAGAYPDNISRPAEITMQFKKLLADNVRLLKSPSAYAEKLNISESYLNESLKKTTNSPVIYWIQQEVLMEAKRLLHYSDLTVKEVAHELGYINHSYFCRFFRKAAGMTALTFRELYKN